MDGLVMILWNKKTDDDNHDEKNMIAKLNFEEGFIIIIIIDSS